MELVWPIGHSVHACHPDNLTLQFFLLSFRTASSNHPALRCIAAHARMVPDLLVTASKGGKCHTEIRCGKWSQDLPLFRTLPQQQVSGSTLQMDPLPKVPRFSSKAMLSHRTIQKPPWSQLCSDHLGVTILMDFGGSKFRASPTPPQRQHECLYSLASAATLPIFARPELKKKALGPASCHESQKPT